MVVVVMQILFIFQYRKKSIVCINDSVCSMVNCYSSNYYLLHQLEVDLPLQNLQYTYSFNYKFL